MSTERVNAILPTRNFAASSAWYERLFGRAPDRCPSTSCAEWMISAGTAIQLQDGASMSAAPDSLPHGAVGIVVADLDSALAALRQRQIDVAAPQRATRYVRFAPVADPDGNTVTFVESVAG